MKFLLLGATGKTGSSFLTLALDEGHDVTAITRDSVSPIDPRARRVIGDVTDPSVVAEAAEGHDAIVSALGARRGRGKPTLITAAVRAVIAAADLSGVDRFLIVSAFGVEGSISKASGLARLIFRASEIFVVGDIYRDKAAGEELLRRSTLRWTAAYPGRLNDREVSAYGAVAIDELERVRGVPITTRVNLAHFLLNSAVKGTFVWKAVFVANEWSGR